MFEMSPITKTSKETKLLSKVQFDDSNSITRATLVQNEKLVTLALEHVGTRVSVRTLEVHVQSLYSLMEVNVPGHLVAYTGFLNQ